jgi:aryl sulfotransferase
MQKKTDSSQSKPELDRNSSVRTDPLPASSPASPSADKEPETRATALLHEVRQSMAPIRRGLSAAGFGDIHDDELLVLLALGMNKKNVDSLLPIAEVADQAVGSITETLLSRGYLERKENPDVPGQSSIALSEHGAMACMAVDLELRAQRWAHFPFRQGDIVICAPPKSGTTWVQMICALLIFQTSDLPAPLPELSPWLDKPEDARSRLFPQLAAQEHRRFIKAHLPLDKIAIDSRATYIVVARHPLDVLLSLHHINGLRRPQPPLRELLPKVINGKSPQKGLPGLMHYWSVAWARRDEPNVVLLRYEDLVADLAGQMRSLAARLDITVPETTWPGLVKAATFEQMRAAADQIQPMPNLKDPAEFFWKGKPGSARALLTDDDLARYDERAAQLAPADLLAWLKG